MLIHGYEKYKEFQEVESGLDTILTFEEYPRKLVELAIDYDNGLTDEEQTILKDSFIYGWWIL